jgi:TolB-like protein
MSKFVTVALAGTLGLAALAPSALAKEPVKEPPQLTEILADPQAILNVIPALPDSIVKVDPTVVRVFLYNERKRDETESLANVVENRLTEELLRLRRFKVLEAREAKTTRVESTATSFQVSNTIESLSRLRQIGTQVGADAVLMYAPQIQERMVLVNAKLVRVADGELLWTERFAYNFDLQRARREAQARAEEQARADADKKKKEEEKRTKDNGLYCYTGITGFSMRRSTTDPTQPDAVSPSSIGFGMMGLRNTALSDNAAFGFDLEVDQAGSVNPNLSLPMLSVGPMFMLRLDPIFKGPENDGVFNLYLGPEETLVFQRTLAYQFTGKAGLMIRFMPDMFLNLGAVYVPNQTISFTSSTGLADTVSNFGGLTYQVTFGLAFK